MSVSELRRVVDEAMAETRRPAKDFTVLATQNDPFRVDTPARHRDGAWLAMQINELGLAGRPIHLRGLHYAVLGRTMPNGQPYTNTEACWLWLSEDCGKAARWLGYLPFDQITDQRNTAPVVRVHTPPEPDSYLTVGIDAYIPDAEDIVPQIRIDGFTGTQPYKLVLFGEKSSLEPVLGPIAETYHADLYLPTGEISDTLLHQMAAIGAEDGRRMVVLSFSDCDPAGWQMPISISRKLQAFRALGYDLDFEVRRVALIPEQVREYGLPSTPLKATERRADRWRAEMGVQQTEVDALASLQPDLLRRLARAAIRPFFDSTLADRVSAARHAWLEEAQAIIDASLNDEHLALIQAEAAHKLEAMRAEIDSLNEALRIDTSTLALPDPVIPEARLDQEPDGHPLVDSDWPFPEQCRRLIESKAYRNGNGVR